MMRVDHVFLFLIDAFCITCNCIDLQVGGGDESVEPQTPNKDVGKEKSVFHPGKSQNEICKLYKYSIQCIVGQVLIVRFFRLLIANFC